MRLLLMVWVLVVVLWISVAEDISDGLGGTLTFEHFEALYADPQIFGALWNTLGFAILVVNFPAIMHPG